MAAPELPRKSAKSGVTTRGAGAPGWILRTPTWVPAVLIAMASVGCAGEVDDAPVEAQITTATSDPRIFGGSRDDDGESLPGVVALRVGAGTTFELCSGALIAPNVVLTARHCVTKNVSSSVACDENGQSANGPHVSADEAPADIGVYVGASPKFGRAPLTTARAIVAPSGPYLCDSDIALVVLAEPITDVAPLAVRITAGAREGERIRSVGYGQSDTTSPIGTRFRKDGVEVLAQGKGISRSKTPLGTHEFEVGKSICQGDSGGPAISEESGAVIGVVSRGGACDEDFGHIYTTTSGFEQMFADAFALAGAAPTEEPADMATAGTSASPTRSAGTSASAEAPGTAPAACAVTRGGANGAGAPALALGFVATALAALTARRRRAR